MKVHVMTPYSLTKNLGEAYNQAMALIPDGDWACFIDYDVQFLTPDAIAVLHEYAKLYPDAGMLTCFTNRIFCKEQLLSGKFSENPDMLHHIKLAEIQRKQLYKATQLQSLTSGFLMLISKSMWMNHKFVENGKCLAVDNEFAKSLYAAGKKVIRMDGLYVFHNYRLGKNRFDTSHLKKQQVKIVYTSIFDNYDELKPVKPAPGWKYICFTNTDMKADGWEVVKVDKEFRINRKIKLMPHKYLPPHDISIYRDGNIELADSPDKIIEGKNYCVMIHPDRNNLQDELKACIRLKKGNEEQMTKQVEQYLSEGYPGQGLTSNGVIIRKNSEQNNAINEAWWNEVLNHSGRDQLSFGYVCWKNKLNYETFPFLQGFDYRRHDSKTKIKAS